MKKLIFAITALTVFSSIDLSASVASNEFAETKRFKRGSGAAAEFQSFVIPLDRQKGVEMEPNGDSISQFPHLTEAPWFSRIDKSTRNHYSEDTGSHSISFENPIAAFGAEGGGTSLYTNRSYSFGLHAGFSRDKTTLADPLTAFEISIKSYDKTDFGSGQTNVSPTNIINYRIPRRDSAEWQAMLFNGRFFDLPPIDGLTTMLQIVERTRDSLSNRDSWALNDDSVAYVLTHSGGGTDFYYVVEVTGYYENGGGWEPLVKDAALVEGVPSPLYTLDFSAGPSAWESKLLNTPQFDSEPLPPSYHDRTVEELLSTNAKFSKQFTAPGPSEYLDVDLAPELRSHQDLNDLVASLNNDPIRIANYVLNEIRLVDPIGYNHDGNYVESTITDPGIKRGAYGVYISGEGSPTEQCALLIYLLREAGVQACYAEADRNGVKMLDHRLSKILRMQLVGAKDDAGDAYNAHLISVDYPWVAAYVPDPDNPPAKKWVHLFPWLKDTEIKEGLDLQEIFSEPFQKPDAWTNNYLRRTLAASDLTSGAESIDELLDNHSHAELYRKFLTRSIELNLPETSLDNVGVTIRDRRNNYTEWDDFPQPWSISEDVAPVTQRADMSSVSGIYDLFRIIAHDVIIGDINNDIAWTGFIRACEFNNRVISVRPDSSGRMTIRAAAFDPDVTGEDVPGDPKDFLNTANIAFEQKIATNSTDNGDKAIRLTYLYVQGKLPEPFVPQTHYTDPFSIPETVVEHWDSFLGVTRFEFIERRATLPAGSTIAILEQSGSVNKRMINTHVKQILKAQRKIDEGAAPADYEDIFLGTMPFLAANMWAYHESNIRAELTRLNKLSPLFRQNVIYSSIVPAPGGNERPFIDVTGSRSFFTGNAGMHREVEKQAQHNFQFFTGPYNLSRSYQEGDAVGDFYDSEAVSTVHVIHDSVKSGATLVDITEENYVTQGETSHTFESTTQKLKDWAGTVAADNSITLWEQVLRFIERNEENTTQFSGRRANLDFESYLMTPIPVAYPAPISADIMALWGNTSEGEAVALVSEYSLNGAWGAEFVAQITPPNYNQIQTRFDTQGLPIIQIGQPAVILTGSALNLDNDYKWNYENRNINLINDSYVTTDYQIELWNQAGGVLSFTIPAGDPALEAAADEIIAESGFLGNTNWYGNNDSKTGLGKAISDPVNVITGEFYVDQIDLSLAGPMPLELRRNYSSQNLANGNMGYGWRLSFIPYLVLSTDDAVIYAAEPDGSVIAYTRQAAPDDNLWTVELANNPNLVNQKSDQIGSTINPFHHFIEKTVDGTDDIYTLTTGDGSSRIYRVASYPISSLTRERPYLQQWNDNRGNFFTFTYGIDSDESDWGELIKIQSSNGNFIGFNYDPYGHVEEAFTADGRRVYYDYDQYGDLRKVIRPDASEISYDYEHDLVSVDGKLEEFSRHLIVRESKPEGRILENTYHTDGSRRVVEQRATVGEDSIPVRNATFIYSTTETNGFISGNTKIQDALHTAGAPREWTYTFADNRITQIVDAENQTLTQQYYADTDVSTGAYPRSPQFIIDKRGLRTDYAYDNSGNPETVTVTGDITGDGATDVATTITIYNSLKLPATVTDPVNNQIKFFYTNTDYPYLPTRIERHAPGGMISQTVHTYHAMVNGTSYTSSPPQPGAGQRAAYGLLQSVSRAQGSSDEATDTFTHNDQGFITGSSRPTGTADPTVTMSFKYNARGELEKRTDAAGRYTRFAYDGLGNRIWQERYDAADNLIWWNYDFYNGNGDLEWSDGPRYHGTTSGAEDYIWRRYDGAGRLAEQIHWRSEAKDDGSGTQSAAGDALYATTLMEYNAFGDLLEIRDPNTHLTKMAYDKIGRMTERWAYDGPTDSDPLLSHEIFDHEPGDQVTSYTNPKGGVTTTLYTATGKPRQQSHPDNTVLEWRYYLDGRVQREPLNHSLYWDITYDDLSRTVTKNLTAITGGVIATRTEVYDRRGNLTDWTDLEGHSFSRTYDNLDRVTSETGPPATASAGQQSTTYTYDAAGITQTATNALNEQTVTTRDAIGRVSRIDVKDSTGTTIRTTSFTYAPDHHSVTRTEGTGGDAIATTTHTDTFGNTVLTTHADATFTLQAYDPAGNLTASTDEMGQTTTLEYDGLNRLRFQTLPDTAQIELRYDSGSNLTHRIMPAPPGGSTFQSEAAYDSANRMISRKLHDGSADSRTFSYGYYPAGDFRAGLLQTVTDPRSIVTTHHYDDFRRIQSATMAGSNPEHNITTTYGYDDRSLLTSVTQTHADYSTLVSIGYDGYGQLTSEIITLDGQPHSDMAQTWDAAGRRDSLTPASAPSAFGYSHRADGLMKQATFDSRTYDFTFADNGLLTTRTNPFRTVSIPQRDSRGRIESQATSVNGTTVLTETLQWQDNSRMDDYAVTRTTLGGNAPPVPSEYRDFTYNNERGRLTSETYGPSGTQSVMNYEFDDGNTAGLGIRSRAQLAGGGYLIDSTTINSFARTTAESTDAEPKSFTATGTAFGAGEVNITLQSSTSIAVNFPGWEDATGGWSADLTLPPGSYSLTAEATHPSGWKAPADTNNFTVQGTTETATSTYDEDGNTITRTFSVSGRVQTLTWDGKGRLIRVEERNASNDGYDWTAIYDGLNRRLATSYQPITNHLPSPNSHLLTTKSSFDPEVEFLEIGLTTDDTDGTDSFWKVYGPDANGAYGGLQGIGGLEAVIEDGGATTGIVSDAYGHVVARSDGTSITWSDSRSLSYGPQPGTWSPPVPFTLNLAPSLAWRGKYADPTGLLCLGARYYEPNSGRFISPDPLGHSASMDLYSYASGDPVNFVDPDGRFGKEALGFNSGNDSLGSLLGRSLANSSASNLNIIGQTYNDFQGNLSIFDGNVFQAGNATLNPAFRAGRGFTEFGTGLGLSPSNFANDLSNLERGFSFLEGSVATVETVGVGFGGAGLTSRLGFSGAAKTPVLRQQYVDEVGSLSDLSLASRGAGADAAATARLLHAERNALKLKYRELTPPDVLKTIEARNLEKYGNTLGPSIEQLRAAGKSWDDIIESATRAGGKDLGF